MEMVLGFKGSKPIKTQFAAAKRPRLASDSVTSRHRQTSCLKIRTTSSGSHHTSSFNSPTHHHVESRPQYCPPHARARLRKACMGHCVASHTPRLALYLRGMASIIYTPPSTSQLYSDINLVVGPGAAHLRRDHEAPPHEAPPDLRQRAQRR